MTGPWMALVVLLWLSVVALAMLVLGTIRRASAILQRLELRAGAAFGSGPQEGLVPGDRIGGFTLIDAEGRVPLGRAMGNGPIGNSIGGARL